MHCAASCWSHKPWTAAEDAVADADDHAAFVHFGLMYAMYCVLRCHAVLCCVVGRAGMADGHAEHPAGEQQWGGGEGRG